MLDPHMPVTINSLKKYNEITPMSVGQKPSRENNRADKSPPAANTYMYVE
jgi:hypothetical protein